MIAARDFPWIPGPDLLVVDLATLVVVVVLIGLVLVALARQSRLLRHLDELLVLLEPDVRATARKVGAHKDGGEPS